ncbi:MAG: VWA domain-containing protein [Terracidiphilus sp.]
MKFGLTASAITTLLGSSVFFATTGLAQQQAPAVPDAPAPQGAVPLRDVSGPITPGIGANANSGPATTSTAPSSSSQTQAPAQESAPAAKDQIQTTPPEMPPPEELGTILRVNVTYVEVPVTVKDSKGKLVAGLTWRDFRVFENGAYEPLKQFFVDPFPLSVAFVIDQSLTADVMQRVNDSLGAIQGALTPYDEIAIFSYNNGAQERTGFTGAQSGRVPAVLALTKETGREEMIPYNSGPMAGCNVHVNGNCADPNIQPGRSTGSGPFITIPKEIHTLNDAILAAAKELSTRPKGRRRIIYVISDGKEYGSKASFRDVLRYLQTNNIAVWATLVGDSARWGEGYVSRFHMPFQMYNNILVKYTALTGGSMDAARGLNGIEKSYQEIAQQARSQYTLVYASHESIYDSKFRSIDVRVERPGLEVYAKRGYYPSAEEVQ